MADALIAQSLASERDLRVHSVDVNPAVVDTLKGAARRGATLHLFTGMAETAEQPFQPEYRTYVRQLGHTIGDEVAATEAVASNRLYQHSIAVRSAVLRTITAQRLNIITSRPAGEAPYDIVIATNVFIYFDDRQLALALSNISGILQPGGYLVHNESRAGLVETAVDVGLPLLQMRTVVLGGPPARPLYDTVWLHKKR